MKPELSYIITELEKLPPGKVITVKILHAILNKAVLEMSIEEIEEENNRPHDTTNDDNY